MYKIFGYLISKTTNLILYLEKYTCHTHYFVTCRYCYRCANKCQGRTKAHTEL